jgi:hypothetical protein
MKRHTSTKRSIPSRKLPQQRKSRMERFTIAELLEARTLLSSTFIVTNTADHGAGSLRQAIMSANTSGDSSNLITFNIAGSGPQVISLLTALPAVSATVTIDATTQPGYGGTPLIELDGSMLGSADFGLPGLELDGSGDIVRGLHIYHFYDGIDVNGPRANMVGFHGSHVQILDNFIGLTPHPADFDYGNQNNGITIDSGSIGTNLAAGAVVRGNVIYGNNGYGVAMVNVNGATIAGNIIGLDATGMLRMSNTADGINLIGSSHVTIGGSAAADRNLISANNGNGIYLEDSSSNSILGNLIGTDISGRLVTDATGELFGNDFAGIKMVGSNTNSSGNLICNNVIGNSGAAGIYIDTYVDGSPLNVIRDNLIGTNAMGDMLGNADGVHVVDGSAIVGQQGHGNVIADNLHSGVTVEFGIQVAIRANSIFSNGDLGIDLGDDGVTPNGSAPAGFANNGQVFPVLTSVTRAGSLMTVNGMLTCAPGVYTIDFFSNDVADPSGYGEGKTYLGCTTVTVGASGTASFTVMFAGVTSDQTFATATATDTLGDTSEFSQDAAIVPVAMPTTTMLLSSMGSTVFGQPVTFTATVSAASGTPGGSVVFMDGSTVLGSAMLDASGMATLTVSSLSVGDHSITASYGGDANDLASDSAALMHHVDLSHTATTLSSSMSSATYGQPVTFTAVVSIADAGAGTLSGMVTFMDGSTVLGSAALDSGGMASLTISSLAVGGHSITASYGGDASFAASSSNAVNVSVDLIPTTTMLVSSMASSFFGQSVTFTATVTAASGAMPGGSVLFMDGASVLGSATLDAFGMATLTVSSLAVGSHSITATYGGSSTDGASTGSLTQVVNQNTTATTLSSSAASITYGQSVTFTAAVSLTSAGAGMPGGNVAFMDGSTVLGTVALDGSGMAMLTVSNLSVGGHTITATYVGDGNDMGSSSAALSESVAPRPTSSTLISSANPSTFGQSVTFTAAVTNGGAGGLGGSVLFMDGSTVLATVSLNSSGTASFTLSTLAVGSHTITATYSGDAGDSASSASLSQVVNPVPSALASISGHVYIDRTGNRLSADDTALGGVTVMLFRDRNNNGVLDGFDGPAVASTVSSASGAYSFANVAAGRYFVLEITPFGYVQTAPTKPGYYTATITAANNSVSGLDFDNFRLFPKGHDDPHGHDHDGDKR